MTRTIPLVVAAVLALVGWTTLDRERVTPDQRQAAVAVAAWIEAAARTDVRAVCATEAPPEGFTGSVTTTRGVARGTWTEVCPKTHDTATLASKAATLQSAASAGPSSTLPWANGAQIRVNYADQNLAFLVTKQPEGWRVLSDAEVAPPVS